jgi:Secretion system C-terminal sorting domain/Immunoglobulin I-set domain
MKKLLLLLVVFISLQSNSQCPAGTFDNTGFFPGFVTPSQPGIANENTAHAAWGGDYYIFNVTAGNTYVFRSCFPENSAINTVLSLYNTAGTTLLTFNDDFCSVQSQISWLATFTGQVRLSYYQSGCATQFVDTKLGIYYTTPCTGVTISTHPLSSTVCNGSNTSFSVAANGTAPLSYQWQVNSGAGFTNISNGGVYTNATTATLNITGATTAINSYLYRCVVTNGCGNATSNNATLTVNATNNWTGAVNNDWHTAGNWSCGTVPSSTDDVVISAGNPVIAAGAIGRCRNMSKSGFASAINLSGATLQLFGNLTYTGGSFTTNAGSSFEFKGTTQQSASGASPLTITNLLIDNNNGVVMNKNISVSGTLSLQAGNIYTNNFLLTANTISGAGATRYIITGDASNNPATTGGLRMNIAVGATKQFPIGPRTVSFNPCTIQNTAGPAEDFTIRVNLSPLAGAAALQTVQRTWQIDEATIGGNTATLTLQWDASHEGASFIRTYCGIYKSNGTAIDYAGYTGQNGAAALVSGTTWQKQLTGVTSFSPWGVTSTPSVLPLQLSYFKLQLTNEKKVQLDWKMEQGSTPVYFEVLRSTNTLRFDFVKRVDANAGTDYHFTDEHPFTGNSFYILKMVGNDGEIKYSNTLRATISQNNYIQSVAYPNPVKDVLHLQLNVISDDIASLYLIDAAGKQVSAQLFRLNVGSNYKDIHMQHLPAGIYQLVLVSRNGATSKSIILKE